LNLDRKVNYRVCRFVLMLCGPRAERAASNPHRRDIPLPVDWPECGSRCERGCASACVRRRTRLG